MKAFEEIEAVGNKLAAMKEEVLKQNPPLRIRSAIIISLDFNNIDDTLCLKFLKSLDFLSLAEGKLAGQWLANVLEMDFIYNKQGVLETN